MTEDIRGVLQGALLVLAALFPIVNPLGNAPLFLSLTADASEAQRKVLARKVAVNGFVLLVAAIFAGDLILDFFGVSVPVLQVAGGLVVASLGFRLLHDSGEATAPGNVGAGAIGARAFYPLTLPLTVGPGSISVAVTVGANFPSTLQPYVGDALSALVGVLAVCASIYACYAFAERLTRALGSTGLAVVMRLSAFILLCIGVQIMWNGADALFGISAARRG
ncbi:MAG: MarC family protein [Burkholderiales bacterium]|nr:MarC family protein [Burkholderiales bacterium]